MRELTLSDGTTVPMPWAHPGPQAGHGRSHGRPFAGVVEDTPCLWVTWFRALARGYGKTPGELQIEANGAPLRFISRRLTYGERWYFVCPRCGRLCEALYLLRSGYACRKCHHLGYRSQVHRPGSPEVAFDDILRPLRRLPRRYFGAKPMREAFEAMLRWQAERGIKRILGSLSFGDPSGRP